MTARPSFYREQAGVFVPTGLGVSPWNPNAQMGVCLVGLLVRALDLVPMPVPMMTARLTIDILGAVPLQGLAARTRVLREGRRVQLVEAELYAGERCWLRGTAVRLRTESSPESSVKLMHPAPEADVPPPPEGHWMQMLRLAGDHRTPGPGSAWIRIMSTLVEGEAPTPLQNVAMVSDFGSGIAPLVPMADWTFANVDVSVHLTRAPAGEWLLIDAASESAGTGVGLTHSRLGDANGMIGMAHQTTFLQHR